MDTPALELSTLNIASSGSTPLLAAKAELAEAVDKFEETYSVYASSKAKSSPIPNITLKQVITSYNFTTKNADASLRDEKFGLAVENLLLASVSEKSQPLADNTKKTRRAKEAVKEWVEKTGKLVGKLLPLATVACELTSVVGDASVLALPLKSAANGIAVILQLAQKENDRREDFIAELNRISYQSRRVSEIQKHHRQAINPLLLEKSLGLMTQIINFLAASLIYWQHGFFYRLGKTLLLGPEVWQGAIKDLHQAYDEYDQALLLQIANSLITESVRNEVSNLDSENDAFKTWLSPSTWEVEAQLVANRLQRVEGSLQWVLDLEKFKKWRLGGHEKDANTPAATLWITGRPGVGKSTISAYLFDILKQQYPENVVLHFFCKSGMPHLNSAHDIVRTICYQLTQKESFYRRYLQSMTALPNSGGSESLVLLFNKLIKEPLEKGMHDSGLFILLDGLDELENSTSPSTYCKYSSKTEIEVLLELLVQLPGAKILISSRQSPELKRILDKSGATHDITRGDNASDIDRYVKFRLEKSSNLSRGFEQIERDPVKFFGEKSNGIFLWVVVVLDILERASTAKGFLSALNGYLQL